MSGDISILLEATLVLITIDPFLFHDSSHGNMTSSRNCLTSRITRDHRNFSGVDVAHSLVFGVVICRYLFCLFSFFNIKFGAHDAFLEKPSSGDENQKIGKPNDLKVSVSNKTKRPKQDSQNRQRPPMHERREP